MAWRLWNRGGGGGPGGGWGRMLLHFPGGCRCCLVRGMPAPRTSNSSSWAGFWCQGNVPFGGCCLIAACILSGSLNRPCGLLCQLNYMSTLGVTPSLRRMVFGAGMELAPPVTGAPAQKRAEARVLSAHLVGVDLLASQAEVVWGSQRAPGPMIAGVGGGANQLSHVPGASFAASGWGAVFRILARSPLLRGCNRYVNGDE